MIRQILSALCATTLAASFALTGAMPLNAAPVMPSVEAGSTDLQAVQYDARRGVPLMREGSRNFRGDPQHFRRDGDRSFYKGYRGHREYRPGYRQYNGWWFPAAAFIAGALITGAIQADRGGVRNPHVSWCYNRYQSYRAHDNTFNPGRDRPRRQCISPYS